MDTVWILGPLGQTNCMYVPYLFLTDFALQKTVIASFTLLFLILLTSWQNSKKSKPSRVGPALRWSFFQTKFANLSNYKYVRFRPQIIPCLSYCPAGIMVISMRSTRVKQFL